MHDCDTTAETLLMHMLDLESERSTLAPEGKHPATSARWAPLQYSASIVFFVFCYATMAVIAWAATCYLSFKPIGAKHYGVVALKKENDGYGWIGPEAYHHLYVRSEEWFRAARVLAAIVATLTIPVATSTMTLANRAWIEPGTWLRLVGAGRASFASSFLIATIFLNLLAALPLDCDYQNTYLANYDASNIDLMDHFGDFVSSFDSGETTALLRDRLASTGMTTPQAQL
ncbi:hypothetical protein B0H19DRAFT_1274064 [Mycena capillaripes]|nr:hypothetical protein B0H19DRAFT_1274064 [Mycena capillaripes]